MTSLTERSNTVEPSQDRSLLDKLKYTIYSQVKRTCTTVVHQADWNFSLNRSGIPRMTPLYP